MTGDRQGDWAERQTSRRSGRHSRGPEGYGDPDPYAAPDQYAQPDPYAQNQYGQPDPYAAPDRYQPDSYAAPDRFADPDPDPLTAPGPDPLTAPGRFSDPGPDPLTAPGRFSDPGPDPLTAPGRFSQPGPDPLTAPGRFDRPDPLTAPGPYAPPDPYAEPDRSAQADPYSTRPPRAQPDPARYGQPGPHAWADRGPDPDADAQTDPSADRPAASPRRDDYAARAPLAPPDRYPGEPYDRDGGRPGSFDAAAGPGGQNGYGPPDSFGPAAGPGSQNGYGPPDSFGPPAGPGSQNGYGPPDSFGPPAGPGSQNGYGPPDSFGPPAGPGSQNGYGPPAVQGNGDHGPYRWRPPAAASGPEDLAPLPDYHGGTEHQPQPESRDWDASQEHDWDVSQGDSAVGLAEPVSGPVDRGPWPPEPSEPDEPGEWDDAPSREGLIPGFRDSGSGRGRGRGGRPRRRVSRVIAPLLALVLLVALGAGGYKIYQHFQSPDFTGPGTGEVTVQVLNGDTATSLAPRLVKLGVVASTSSFISAAKDSSNPDGLEPGFFRLRRHMNSALAYQMLLNPKARIQSVVTIPEGVREAQILTTLEAKTGISASAFAAALKDTAALNLPSYAKGNAEGYLFPATYNFNPGTSALSMLQTMVARYNQEAASINLPAAAKAAQLSEAQVITVASILEAEAGNPKYYPDVAEVIYNRLNQGMFLGLDSTVNYALHRFGVSLTTTQLHVNSPYNTFIHLGLPPGPIDSPGNAAIDAALHPAHGNLLYFVTVNLKTGLTLFTNSPTQFAQFENECQQNHAC